MSALAGASRPGPDGGLTAERVVLGSLISNGGDAAIMRAQLGVIDDALGPGRTTIEGSEPRLVRQFFPDVTAVGAGRVQEGLAGLARTLRRRRRGPFRRFTDPVAFRLLPWLGARMARRELTAVLERSDVVFHTGGTTLIEQYDLRAKFANLRLAVAAGRPLVLLPQSLGPFRDPVNAAAVREVVTHARLVLLRDERSRAHLEAIGAPLDRVRVVPDIVFSLTSSDAVPRLAASELTGAGLKVVVGTRDCRKFFDGGDPERRQAALEQQYADLVVSLVRDRSATVTFVSTCQGVDGYWTDDSAVALAVSERLPPDVRARCTVDRDLHDTESFREIMSRHDLAVSTRLHGAILALSVGLPCVAVEYEFKTGEVFSQLGQRDAVYSIEQVEDVSLAEHVDRFVHGWADRRTVAAQLLGAMVETSTATADLVRAAVVGVDHDALTATVSPG